MDKQIIEECRRLSLEAKITFPEIVKRLSAIGVERYIVDLIGLQTLTFSSQDDIHVSPFTLKKTKVSEDFHIEQVKKALSEVQQQKIDYVEFLHRIMEAGCIHYEVFFKGRRVFYFGRDGSHHIEYFPPAAKE